MGTRPAGVKAGGTGLVGAVAGRLPHTRAHIRANIAAGDRPTVRRGLTKTRDLEEVRRAVVADAERQPNGATCAGRMGGKLDHGTQRVVLPVRLTEGGEWAGVPAALDAEYRAGRLTGRARLRWIASGV